MIKNATLLFFLLFPIALGGQVLLADFETVSPALTPSGVTVVNNPDKTGNASNKVGYFRKPAQNWQAFYLSLSNSVSIKKYTFLKFKLRIGVLGRVYAKFWNGNTVITEGWAPNYGFMPPANTWTECMYDVTNVQNQSFTHIEINAGIDNLSETDVYFDDFVLTSQAAETGIPVADFKISANRAFVDDTLTFDASESFDANGKIVNYEWDFQDGTTDTGQIIKHIFKKDGFFQVKLTVTDNEGNKATTTKAVSIFIKNTKIGGLVFQNMTPSVNEKIEAAFLINNTYANNFDSDEVKVDAEITLPDLSKINVPCFYFIKNSYDSVSNKWIEDAAFQYWSLRFSSNQAGEHKVLLKLTDAQGTVSGIESSIFIKKDVKKGIIKPDAQNKQFYRRTTGEPFYPLGINAAWDNMGNYTKIIGNLSKAKANLIRYWHAAFGRQQLEWKNDGFNKGLGIYSQGAAAMQDSILDLCDKTDMHVQMVFFHHGMFSENVNSNWSDNPYNVANGGFLTKPEAFFYDENAKRRVKKLIRYIVARWGYSPRVFAWELFNEVQFTGNNPNQSAQWKSSVISWHGEMAQYIKSLDPFGHIVTTSASDAQLLELDNQSGLDNVQYHIYNPDLLNQMNAKDLFFKNNLRNKSITCGEYGQNVNTADVPLDMHRTAIFGGIMSQTPRLMWLWDNYRADTAWSAAFRLPAQYLEDVDFVKEGKLTSIDFTASNGAQAYVTRGFKTDKNNFYGLVFDNNERRDIAGVSMVLPILKSGLYRVTAYLPIDNKIFIIDSLSLTPARNVLTLPIFSKSVAFKVTYLSEPLVATEEAIFNKIKTYPNPVSDVLNIEFLANETSEAMVEIINLNGQVLQNIQLDVAPSQLNRRSLSLQDYPLSSGVYFIKIMNGNSVLIQKIVVSNA